MREGLTDRAIFSVGIVVGIIVALVSLLSPAPARVTEQVTGIGAPPPPPLETRARKALAAGELDKAVDLYRRAAKKSPEDPRIAYNHACVLSIAGHADQAIAELDRSVTLGFADSEHIRTDEDLVSLRGTDAYERVVERAEKKDPQHQLDFFVGTWEVRDTQGTVVARSDTLRLHGGKLYLEAWKTEGGEETTIYAFDPEQGAWERTRFSDDGRPRWRYAGKMDDSGNLILTPPGSDQAGSRRLRFEPMPDGTFQRHRESLLSDGAWQIEDTVVFVPSTGSIWAERASNAAGP